MILDEAALLEMGYLMPRLYPDGTWTAVQRLLTNGRIVRGSRDVDAGIDDFW